MEFGLKRLKTGKINGIWVKKGKKEDKITDFG